MLAYSDETFNEALRSGFGSAITREWAWREKRGESLANLRPFAAFVSRDAETASTETDSSETDSSDEKTESP